MLQTGMRVRVDWVSQLTRPPRTRLLKTLTRGNKQIRQDSRRVTSCSCAPLFALEFALENSHRGIRGHLRSSSTISFQNSIYNTSSKNGQREKLTGALRYQRRQRAPSLKAATSRDAVTIDHQRPRNRTGRLRRLGWCDVEETLAMWHRDPEYDNAIIHRELDQRPQLRERALEKFDRCRQSMVGQAAMWSRGEGAGYLKAAEETQAHIIYHRLDEYQSGTDNE